MNMEAHIEKIQAQVDIAQFRLEEAKYEIQKYQKAKTKISFMGKTSGRSLKPTMKLLK